MISKHTPEGKTLIDRAENFAAHAHIGQVRKYTGEPYLAHCISVAGKVSRRTDDAEVIAAAYLHDVLEDTDTTYASLEESFGTRISIMVYQLTDVFTPERHPMFNRAERKEMETQRLASISSDAKLIKLCDIADNTKSIVEHDPEFAAVYLKEKAAMLEVLT